MSVRVNLAKKVRPGLTSSVYLISAMCQLAER